MTIPSEWLKEGAIVPVTHETVALLIQTLKTYRKGDFELVGYFTGEYWDSYPVFLSVEKLNDYEIDVSEMTPVYILN